MLLENQSATDEAILIANGYSTALAQSAVAFMYSPIVSQIQLGENIFDLTESVMNALVFPVLDVTINTSLDKTFSESDLGYTPGSVDASKPPFQHNWSLLSHY